MTALDPSRANRGIPRRGPEYIYLMECLNLGSNPGPVTSGGENPHIGTLISRSIFLDQRLSRFGIILKNSVVFNRKRFEVWEY
jgi:hypothetical protein